MMAATGIHSKQREKTFQIFNEHLLLPSRYKIVTLIIEPVHSVDFRALMIASEDKEIVFELDFIG